MAKIPVKLVMDTAKVHGPKVLKFVKENKDIATAAAPLIAAGTKKIKDFKDNKVEKKAENTADHIRKKQFKGYKTIDLNTQNRSQLIKLKHEVENFISQIHKEEEQELIVKKPLYSKKIKNWNSLLVQTEDQLAVLDYQEYLKIYNNPAYQSNYFEGFDRLLEKFKIIIESNSSEELYAFIHAQTRRDIEVIKKDFL